MKGIIEEMQALGNGIYDTVSISGVSYHTLRRINLGDPSVKPDVVAKVARNIEAWKRENLDSTGQLKRTASRRKQA